MAESQWIYLFDRSKGNALMYADVLEDGQTMPDNATIVVCPDGLYDPYFDEQAQTWKGITKEEWEAKLPQHPVEPTDQQKLDAQTQIQLAQLLQQNKKQATFNAQLTVDVATLKKQLAETTKAAQ
ncbi:hypothetical protein [Limosilactobacillus urinaemulieris]|uniref:hypothetical protein n=1 Tax=Limosilactobacillus urinaemulieris TaxID=2742600 RepID=UPI0024BBB6BA|nr:hypothetical protein [Limosilactobacillus urinaemulieris]